MLGLIRRVLWDPVYNRINEFGEVIVMLFTVSGFGLIKVW